MENQKKCHICKGTGRVQPKLKPEQITKTRKQEDVKIDTCGYCHGKGWRNKNYGVDSRND